MLNGHISTYVEELNEVEMSWQDNVKGLVQVHKKWLNMIGPFGIVVTMCLMRKLDVSRRLKGALLMMMAGHFKGPREKKKTPYKRRKEARKREEKKRERERRKEE